MPMFSFFPELFYGSLLLLDKDKIERLQDPHMAYFLEKGALQTNLTSFSGLQTVRIS